LPKTRSIGSSLQKETSVALRKFGFLVTGSGLNPQEHVVVMKSLAFEMTAIGVESPDQGIEVAKQMVEDGVELIELCGGFGPVWTAKILEAINGAVPVGSVGYGPEAIDQLAALFA
jgi:predicted polyphosphate/ATP-dependent NAD kinase